MPDRWVCTTVEQLQPFERSRTVGLREAGWTNGRLLHMLGTIYRWCVAAFGSDLWNIPTPTDQVLDGRVIPSQVKIDVSCENSSRPNSIQGRNPETCCTCSVTKDHWEPSACSKTQITCAYGQATNYTSIPPSTATWCHERVDWRVEWALFSSVLRVCSVCMRVMDIHLYSVDLVIVIFRSAFAHDTQYKNIE